MVPWNLRWRIVQQFKYYSNPLRRGRNSRVIYLNVTLFTHRGTKELGDIYIFTVFRVSLDFNIFIISISALESTLPKVLRRETHNYSEFPFSHSLAEEYIRRIWVVRRASFLFGWVECAGK